jgi:hypothetical protein
MDRRAFLGFLGTAVAAYAFPRKSLADMSSRQSIEDSLIVDPIDLQKAESLAAAVENDEDSFDKGRQFLEALHEPPMEGLQKILLEYEFSTRYTVLIVGLPLTGRASIMMERKNGGYDITARIKKMGGAAYRIGQVFSFLHLKKLPNIDYEIQSKMAFENGKFVPVSFRKNDKEKHVEEVLEFFPGYILHKQTGTTQEYHGEPDPFSMFFSYLLLDKQDTTREMMVNLSKKTGVDYTLVETVKEEVVVDDKTYSHKMRVKGDVMDMVKGGISFSNVDDGRHRIPVRAFVPRFKVDHGEYEIKIKLKTAVPTYDQ